MSAQPTIRIFSRLSRLNQVYDVAHKLQQVAGAFSTNAGADGSIVVGKIMEKDQYSYGFDAQSGEYGNLVSKGIIDPTKVVRCALQDAASVAGLLITTEAMVAELPKKEPPMPAMPCRWHGRDGLLSQAINPSTQKGGWKNPGPVRSRR